MEEFVAVIIITTSLLILACAFLLCVWSVCRSLRLNKRRNVENRVPVGTIGWITFVALLLVSLPTFFVFSFTDSVLVTAGIAMIAALGCLVYSVLHSGIQRKA